jgi:hypothetical protein
MDTFQCEKCKVIFKTKFILESHLKRKTPCIVFYIKKDDNTYDCKFCFKNFARSTNVNLHIDTCIEKIKFDCNQKIAEYQEALDKRDDIIELKDKKIKSLEHQLEDVHNMLVKLDKRKVKKTINQNTTNNTTNNNTTNNQNSNNTIANSSIVTNNFIVSFGEETIDKLSQRDKKEILDNCLFSIVKCVEKIHFNDDIPNQQNAYLTNLKADYGFKNVNGKFIATDIDDLIDTIIENRKEDVRAILNKGDIKISNLTLTKLKELLNKLDKGEGNIEYIRKDIKLLLYNNREKVIANCDKMLSA